MTRYPAWIRCLAIAAPMIPNPTIPIGDSVGGIFDFAKIKNRLSRRRSPAVPRASGLRHELVLDRLSILRVKRFAPPEHDVPWQSEHLRELVDERILLGQEVRNALSRRTSLERGHAWRTDRRERSRRQLEALRDDMWLRQIDRILDDDEHGQDVSVPVAARRHRGLIAALRPVLSQKPGFHVGRARHERVAFPLADRVAPTRVLGVLRGLRAAIHPDRHGRAIFPCADRVRDRLPLDWLVLAPDAQAKRQ